MEERKSGGGGAPGADLTNPLSPRYGSDLVGVAVRLPTDRVNLLLDIAASRNERLRPGVPRRTKLSELVRHVFDLGMHELQVQEAVNRWARKNRTHTLSEIALAVGLPEDLVRRELRARGFALPDLVPNSDGDKAVPSA